ncbi:MAG: M23 family metallopeptidase, partial [Clostridia bacterium]
QAIQAQAPTAVTNTGAEQSRSTASVPRQGVSSSGGKATYNVSNFEVSKAGADYVNKNSPFSGYRITSYTGARNTGIKGASTNHAGIDRAVPEGTRVSVPINTTFYKSGSDSARGNWIEVKDANGNILHYQHLQSYATGYKAGDPISAGTPFAVSGSSGVGTAHLHEEYYTPDGSVNITESYWNKYAPLN